MDVGTGLTLLGSARLIEKLLGPTAEYIGGGIKEFAEKRTQNIQAIFTNAVEKLGDKINKPGAVPPKVLKEIMTSGSYADDPITTEYFGGVLASSRSESSRDDRGSSLMALLGRLSTYQIRTHYIIYHLIKLLHDGTDHNIGEARCRNELEIYIPFEVYVQGMDFNPEEINKIEPILEHVIFGLQKESLIEDDFKFGALELMKSYFSNLQKPGIILQPSALGVELFLWAYGKADLIYQDYLKTTTIFPINGNIKIIPGSRVTKQKNRFTVPQP